MHKSAYILFFVALGVLLSFVVHGTVEMAAIWLLTRDFAAYGLGLSWETWYALHHAGSIVLLLAGIFIGLWQGIYWHRSIYSKKHR